MEHVEVLRGLSEVCRAAIKAGDWKVDGACDPDSLLRHADAAIASLSAPQPPAEAQRCTCPSGDGSLRWPCPAHPPSAPVGVEALVREIEEGCREHSCTPHDMSLDVEGDTLAALCRAWLALQDAPEVEVREASFSDGRRVGKLIATTDQSMIAQRVRIVKEVG